MSWVVREDMPEWLFIRRNGVDVAGYPMRAVEYVKIKDNA